jgi:hypothetical protein
MVFPLSHGFSDGQNPWHFCGSMSTSISTRLEAPDGHHGQGLKVDICGSANLDVVVHLDVFCRKGRRIFDEKMGVGEGDISWKNLKKRGDWVGIWIFFCFLKSVC